MLNAYPTQSLKVVRSLYFTEQLHLHDIHAEIKVSDPEGHFTSSLQALNYFKTIL